MTTATTLVLASTLASAKSDINAIIGTQKTEAIKFADSSRKRTYQIAQHVLKLGRVLLAEGNELEFSTLLVRNEINAREGTNPWSYVIELAIPGDKTWKNRAGALRALNKHLPAHSTERAAETIDQFQIQKVKKTSVDEKLVAAIGDSQAKRLDGLALLDRLENLKDGDPTEADYLDTALGGEALDLQARQIEEEGVAFVMLWATVKEGKITPMGVVAKSEGAAKKEAISVGRDRYGKPNKEQLKVIVADKIGDIVFGDELAGTTEPAIVREEGEADTEEAA